MRCQRHSRSSPVLCSVPRPLQQCPGASSVPTAPHPGGCCGIHLPGRAGHGAEPAPSWHPALGSTTSLIRCLIFKMLTDFTALSWPRARCGPRWRLLPELGVPEPAPPWVARPWPRAHRPCQACSCSPSWAIPTAAQVILSLCSLPLGRLQAFDSRGLSGHFSSSVKMRVNTAIKKRGSRAVLRLKMALRSPRERGGCHNNRSIFFKPPGAHTNGDEGESLGTTHPQKTAGRRMCCCRVQGRFSDCSGRKEGAIFR